MREHGRAKYVVEKCRCDVCRQACRMKQLVLFPIRDPNTFARGLAKCREALAQASYPHPSHRPGG